MREFTEEEIEKWIDYTDKNVLPKEEFLGRCHQCGDFLVNLELPEGPEKKIGHQFLFYFHEHLL